MSGLISRFIPRVIENDPWYKSLFRRAAAPPAPRAIPKDLGDESSPKSFGIICPHLCDFVVLCCNLGASTACSAAGCRWLATATEPALFYLDGLEPATLQADFAVPEGIRGAEELRHLAPSGLRPLPSLRLQNYFKAYSALLNRVIPIFSERRSRRMNGFAANLAIRHRLLRSRRSAPGQLPPIPEAQADQP